jgi:hypothetical protein
VVFLTPACTLDGGENMEERASYIPLSGLQQHGDWVMGLYHARKVPVALTRGDVGCPAILAVNFLGVVVQCCYSCNWGSVAALKFLWRDQRSVPWDASS